MRLADSLARIVIRFLLLIISAPVIGIWTFLLYFLTHASGGGVMLPFFAVAAGIGTVVLCALPILAYSLFVEIGWWSSPTLRSNRGWVIYCGCCGLVIGAATGAYYMQSAVDCLPFALTGAASGAVTAVLERGIEMMRKQPSNQ